MKLELKHLSPYLPYGVDCFVQGEGVTKFNIVGLNTNFVEYHEKGRSVTEQCPYEDCFLILRPLIDFNNFDLQVVSNRVFIPMDFCDNENIISIHTPTKNHLISINSKEITEETPLYLYKYLLERHFDVFGLIDKGLAININNYDK